MKRPRVLLADDHTLILEGFRAVLAAECEVVGAVRDGRTLVQAALDLAPDVVLLDISMPMLNGIDAGRQIKKALPKTRLIFLTMHSNPTYLTEALAAGASGYVLKTSAREELLEAVGKAMKGGVYVTPGFADSIVETLGARPIAKSRADSILTPRQREILQLVAEGRTAKEIADIVCVSVQTVAFHKYQIMNKLGIRTTAELTKYAIQQGLAGA